MPDLYATYYFRPADGVGPEEAAAELCAEETLGVREENSPRPTDIVRLAGSVESVSPESEGYIARIRFPDELFEPGNMVQCLSVVAGDLFGLRVFSSVRLLDIEFPETVVAPFKGPKFGISGIRHLLGTKDRPHIGIVIQPKVGLSPQDYAEAAYQAAVGGADLIRDSETLTSQPFCPMEDRLARVMERLENARCETGRQVLYGVNISARADSIVDRAKEAMDLGANLLMVDAVTAGFSTLQALSEDPGIKVPIHVNCTMHSALTRNPCQGIALRPLARILRLLGADQMDLRTSGGDATNLSEELKETGEVLLTPFFTLKRVLPVVDEKIHPGKVPAAIRALGSDITLMAGEGIYGHPEGMVAGLHAMRQAVDAVMAGVSLDEYAKDHYELERALKNWGVL
ncbi:MAG TPA: RuBisCO large subunit C-terminal-like domain-containing protein [Methanomicrobiales archaeon]|nr:RuBisCO large subunit C-terminal-like domain-containing protein [Methanomicrobiales archaeon]